MKKIRFGKDIVILWQVLTDGEHTPLGCRDLKLEIRNSLNRVTVLPMQVSDTSCVMKAVYHGKDHSSLGRHTLTLIENYGQCDQRIIDAPQVFALVKSTAEEDADVTKNTYDLHMGEISVGECDAPPSADVPVGDVWDEDNILEQEIRVIHNLREINNYGNVLSFPQDVTGRVATNVDLDTLRNELNESVKTEATQRMAADTALGNRITSVTTTANNNTISLNTLETKFNTNLADLRAKDAELEEAINQEARNRQREDGAIRESIGTVSGRVTTAEEKIAGLQGNVTTLQKEVSKVKDEVVPQAVAEGIARVVASAPDDLNTLEEIAEYIASDKTEAAKINNAISNLKVATQTNYGEIQQLKHDANGTLGIVLDNSRAIQQHTKDIAKNAEDIANHSQAIDKAAKDVVSNTQAINLLAEAVETKAPKVGYAPDLKVDFAKELVGRGVAEPQVIGTIRPTGVISIGDGNATIEKIRGKSVVWNQKYKVTAGSKTENGVTFVNNNDGTVTVYTDEEGATATTYITNSPYRITSKSVIILTGCPAGGSLTGYHQYITARQQIYDIGEGVIVSVEADNYYTGIMVKAGTVITTPITFKPRLYDLTQMFGAGNEPTTIEEFEARKPLGVTEAYNEGEIISYDAQELKSVGFNAFNGTYAKVIGGQKYHALGTITSIGFTTELGGETTEVTLDSEGMFTPAEDGYVYAEGTDICIHLTHTYTPEHTINYEEDILTLPDVKAIKDKDGNQLFPYGLLSAGTVHDEITATKAVKRVGRYVIDGSQKWTTYNQKFRLLNPSIDCQYGKYILLPSKYKALKSPPDNGWANFPDKSILLYNSDVKMFVAWDSTYSTAEDFQASLVDSPIIVNYELATPIEVDLPEPLNMTYDAWDFGTEELIAEGKTTPINADIVYQFNAVDRIRENTTEVATKQQELTLTVLDNGNIRIGNLQGQTKDFMPATPSGDPMHYAYEAMGAVWNGTGKDIVYDASVDYTSSANKAKKPFFLDWGDSYTHKAGFWLMNEVGNLNNADMREILLSRPPIRATDTKSYWITKKQKTNKPNSANVGSSATSYRSVACNATEIKVLSFFAEKNVVIKTNDIHYAFSPASKLEKITNEFSIKEAAYSAYAFYSCPNLEYIKFSELSANICVQCPKLHKLSVKWLIEHEVGEATKTIELHPDVYATLSQDADIQAALEAHPLVTITPYES
jgi:hypothetical protein